MLATCPSGLILQVRGLTGRDGRYLANEKLVRDEEIEDYVFSNTCVEIVDEGVYAFQGKAPEWGKLLLGDRTYLALSIRVASYPNDPYVVPLKCIAKLCRKPFEWEIDIEKMLAERVQTLSEAAREIVKTGGEFSFILPSTVTKDFAGKKVFYKLKTGADSKRYQAAREHLKQSGSKKRKEEQNDLVDGFLLSGVRIDGIDKKEREKRQAFLEDLPIRDINALKIDIERNDCGLDTTIEVECPVCEMSWEIELPFGRELFAPSDPNRRAKREKRIAAEAKDDAADAGDAK